MTDRPSGAELMLRSLGMGEILEAAKALANAGTLEKILKFADAVDPINKKLDLIYEELRRRNSDLPVTSGSDNEFASGNPPEPIRLITSNGGSGAA